MSTSEDSSSESTSQRHSANSPVDHTNNVDAESRMLTALAENSSPDVDEKEGGKSLQSDLVIGWREWISLPLLGLPAIKAKIDTGARTSAIHALEIERVSRNNGQDWLAFSVQPIQRVSSIVRRCEAQLIDIRRVTDSGGHRQNRFFISTQMQIGPVTRTIELTLAQREDMLFRMLLGRTAMVPNIHVDPAQSYTLGRVSARTVYANDVVGAS